MVTINSGEHSRLLDRLESLEGENRELRVRLNEAHTEIGRHHQDFAKIRNIVG